jgi:copper homeostasis protein
MPPILVEACVDTLVAALAAEEGGAGRVEVCASLEVGGLTPPDTLVRECAGRLSIPVFVLVRPTPGSFALRSPELRLLTEQVRRAADLGAAGIVAGGLTDDRTIDRGAIEAILVAAGSLPVTFHRAFDEIADQSAALEALIRMGVGRVLTSGGAPTAAEGVDRIEALVRQGGGRIGVLAGGSVRAHNAAALVRSTGVTEIHSRTPADAGGVRALVLAANSP